MNTTPRQGMWMQTYTGVAWYHADPRPEDVRLLDIAHGLSMLCRFGGHCNLFYSVAEHSVLVANTLRMWGEPPSMQLLGLMHDATEAYVVDVPRPLKRLLGRGYSDIEHATWGAIASTFGFPRELPEIVHKADNAVLLTEKEVLLGPSPMPWGDVPGEPANVTVNSYEPERARSLFLRQYNHLRVACDKEVS
jgi:hypothetical protein